MNYLNFNRDDLEKAIILSGGLNEWLLKVSVDFQGFSDEWLTNNLVSILLRIEEKLSSLYQLMWMAPASNVILTYSHLGYLLSGVDKNKMTIIVQLTQEDATLKQNNIMQLKKLKEIEEIATDQIFGYDLCWLLNDLEIKQNKLYVKYSSPESKVLEYVVRTSSKSDDTITDRIECHKLNPSRLHSKDYLGYDLALMLIDSTSTELFGIQLPLQPSLNSTKPTLIQCGEDYWFHGNTDGKNWKTQKLDSRFATLYLRGLDIDFSTMRELKSPLSMSICHYFTSIQAHSPPCVEQVKYYLPHILEILFSRGHILISPQEKRKDFMCAMGLQFMKRVASPELLVSFIFEADKRNLSEYLNLLFSQGFSLSPTALDETLQVLKDRSLQEMQKLSSQRGKRNKIGQIFEDYAVVYTVPGLSQQFPWQFYELFLKWEQKQADLVRLITPQYILTSLSLSEWRTVNDCIEQYVKPNEERGHYSLYFKKVSSDFSFPELPKDKPTLIQVDGIASLLVSLLPEREDIYTQMGSFYRIILRVKNEDESIDEFYYVNKRTQKFNKLTVDDRWFSQAFFKSILDQNFIRALKLIDSSHYYHINMVLNFSNNPVGNPADFFIYGNIEGSTWQYTDLDFKLSIAHHVEQVADGIYSDRGIVFSPGFLKNFIHEEIKAKSGHFPEVFQIPTLKQLIEQSTAHSIQEGTQKQLSIKQTVALFNIKRNE